MPPFLVPPSNKTTIGSERKAVTVSCSYGDEIVAFRSDRLAKPIVTLGNNTPINLDSKVVTFSCFDSNKIITFWRRSLTETIVSPPHNTSISLQGKTIAMLGLSFKPKTDDIREAPALKIASALIKEGAIVRAHDPEAMQNAATQLPELALADSPYEAADGADALVLVTEWNEFRNLDLERLRDLLNTPVFVDMRNVYKPSRMAELGFKYHSIGRPAATVPASGIAELSTDGSDQLDFLSNPCAFAVSVKERALPGDPDTMPFFRSSPMCSNVVLRLMPNSQANSDIVGK